MQALNEMWCHHNKCLMCYWDLSFLQLYSVKTQKYDCLCNVVVLVFQVGWLQRGTCCKTCECNSKSGITTSQHVPMPVCTPTVSHSNPPHPFQGSLLLFLKKCTT